MASESSIYIGTHSTDGSRGIYRVGFDPASGALGPASLVAEARNPSWLTWHPRLPLLYAVGEIGWTAGRGEGFVSAYALDEDGSLRGLAEQASGAKGPCHCSVHPAGDRLLVANYAGGAVASLPIDPQGLLLPPTTVIEHSGTTGPHPRRQDAAHAHSITVAPDGRFALVCDLGLDRVVIYDLSDAGLTEHATTAIAPGGGPRHLAFHPDGSTVYINHELGGAIGVFAWAAATGSLDHRQTLTTLPGDYAAADSNTTSETRVSDDGRFVYVANRGHDSLAVFAVQDDRSLTFVDRVATGAHPRHFNIDPSGRWLVVASRDDDELLVYARDPTSGLPTPTDQGVTVPRPTCVRFRGEGPGVP